jgi:hypothetical protein
MSISTSICVHGCDSITAGYRDLSDGTASLTLRFGTHLSNSVTLFVGDPVRAEMIANAINRAEDDFEKLAAERADDGTEPNKNQNKEHRLGMHELLGRAW